MKELALFWGLTTATASHPPPSPPLFVASQGQAYHLLLAGAEEPCKVLQPLGILWLAAKLALSQWQPRGSQPSVPSAASRTQEPSPFVYSWHVAEPLQCFPKLLQMEESSQGKVLEGSSEGRVSLRWLLPYEVAYAVYWE